MKTLSFGSWSILGTLPYQADFSRPLREGGDMPALIPAVPANVPGCVYDDLWKAGVIESPYFNKNSLAVEWVANRWWIYRTDFTLTAEDLEKDLKLTFNGIDYQGTLYLNGIKVNFYEGMYISFSEIINAYVHEGNNKLVFVLEDAPKTFGQAGYTSKTHHLKARFNYDWDFACRIVSLGLYDTVTLTAHEGAYLGNILVQTAPVGAVKEGCDFAVTVKADVHAVKAGNYKTVVKWEGNVVAEQECSIDVGISEYVLRFTAENAKLWWPNGAGAQPLYGLDVELYNAGDLTDCKHKRIGLRTMEHHKLPNRPEALEYQLVVNGKKIYRKGTNIVPLTHLTGALTNEHLYRTLKACKDANVNFLRIWGGGHFESEAFYDLADELGLMMMQEFPESSSGCDDLPSRDEHFLGLLKTAVPQQIKRIASHASFCEFDGGNEMEDFHHADQEDHESYAATFEDPILAMFKEWIEEAAPGSYMLPASGSGLNTLFRRGETERNHDVHGPWKYGGPVDHYDLYNNNHCIIHGEFGCGGMTNLSSIRQFMSEDKIAFLAGQNDPVWRHHGGKGWDGYPMVIKPMFGDLAGIDLEDYIALSQYMQYEGLRYSLERHRSKAWNTVGTMTWQFNEPWPNVDCSNVLDFYGGKKLGFYAHKEAYEPVTASLAYEKFFWEAGDVFEGSVTVQNDFAESYAELCAEVVSLEGEIYQTKQFVGKVAENAPTAMGKFTWTVPDGTKGGFVVRITGTVGETSVSKEYLMLIADIPVAFEDVFSANIPEKWLANLKKNFYGKLADWKVVVAFVRKMRQTMPE